MGHPRRVLLAVYSAHVQWLDWQWFPLETPAVDAGNLVNLFYIIQVACFYCRTIADKSRALYLNTYIHSIKNDDGLDLGDHNKLIFVSWKSYILNCEM